MVESAQKTFDKLESVETLKAHYALHTSKTHLKDLLNDEERNNKLRTQVGDDIFFDFTHTKIDSLGFDLLKKVAEEAKLTEKVNAMFNGDKINNTEKRSVLHVALRMEKTESLSVGAEGDVVGPVHEVLSRINTFSSAVRAG